jgi:hypothetical protein
MEMAYPNHNEVLFTMLVQMSSCKALIQMPCRVEAHIMPKPNIIEEPTRGLVIKVLIPLTNRF